jgi:predicted HAD superfamily Cof-like phosphohydrolase
MSDTGDLDALADELRQHHLAALDITDALPWRHITDSERKRWRDEAIALADAASFAARALAEFHEHPNALHEGTNTQALRKTLHEEEHNELIDELDLAADGHADVRQIARELADVVYVAYGSAWAFGIDLDAALKEVHRAAMDKMHAGLRREDGKILKPPGFVAPDMTAAVRNARTESFGRDGAAGT